MDDVCIDNGNITTGTEIGIVDSAKSNRKIVKTKTSATTASTIDNVQLVNDTVGTKVISKSVDNISLLSNELDNVGSVELIFISDEFLNKAIYKQDVIVLKNHDALKSSALKGANGNIVNDAQIVVVSDDFRRKSLQDQKIVIVDKPKKVGNGKTHPKLSRQSSGESSVDDVNNKITSRAFQSYDEESENLESKEIKTAVLEETEILL